MLKISEIFESIQGEVPTGKYSLFIRLYGCNIRCKFCDSEYALNGSYFEIDSNTIHIPESINYIVITGGEPLLQKDELEKFVAELKLKYPNIKIALETNGDFDNFNMDLFDLIVVSPKTFEVLDKWIGYLNHKNIIIKVVNKPGNNRLCNRLSDWIKIGLLKPEYLSKIYIMPFGTTTEDIQSNTYQILKYIKTYNLKGVNVSPRLHIMLNLK